MSRRELVNLGVVTVMFFVMLVWAAQNVVTLDFVDRPYHLRAEFATSPGLREGYEVTYLGVPIGRVGDVRLTGDRVTATLDIQRDVKLPAALDAGVRRKSAVGEPYVNLAPSGDVDNGGPRVSDGALIPLARTTTPPDYSQLFNALVDVIDAVPPDDLHTLVHSLAAGFEGRADDIRSTFANVDQLLSTLAANAPLLDAITQDATTLVHTFTENRDLLGQSWSNLAQLSGVLATKTDSIAALLDRAPKLVDQLDALLTEAGDDIACTFDIAADLWSGLDTPELRKALELITANAPLALDVLRRAYWEGPGGPYLTTTLRFDLVSVAKGLVQPGARPYPVPKELPPVPTVGACDVSALNGKTGVPAETGAGGAGSTAGANAVEVPGRPGANAPAQDPSSLQRDRDGSFLDAARGLVLVAALIGLLALAATVRPWRYFAVLRKGPKNE